MDLPSLQVNGQTLVGVRHEEAVQILRNAGEVMNLMVCEGLDPTLLNAPGKSLGSATATDSVPTTPSPVEERMELPLL